MVLTWHLQEDFSSIFLPIFKDSFGFLYALALFLEWKSWLLWLWIRIRALRLVFSLQIFFVPFANIRIFIVQMRKRIQVIEIKVNRCILKREKGKFIHIILYNVYMVFKTNNKIYIKSYIYRFLLGIFFSLSFSFHELIFSEFFFTLADQSSCKNSD